MGGGLPFLVRGLGILTWASSLILVVLSAAATYITFFAIKAIKVLRLRSPEYLSSTNAPSTNDRAINTPLLTFLCLHRDRAAANNLQ
jgi:hypothetical protein